MPHANQFVWLWKSLEGFHSRLYYKDPLLGSILYLPPQSLSEVLMCSDPRFLESWAYTLNV